MKALEEKDAAIAPFTPEERAKINDRLTEAITSKDRVSADEKFWQERRANLDNHVKKSVK